MLPKPNELLAIDTETRGFDPIDPDFTVVIIGLASDKGCLSFSTLDMTDSEKQELYTLLSQYQLIAHNATFDIAALRSFYPAVELTWKYCTYGLYKQIATEGYPSQKWDLKSAQLDLLGWEEANTADLYDWLLANGYHVKSNKATPDKAQMWRAPASILGKYCALDAEACWQLYKLFERQVLILPEFKELKYYHESLFMPNVMLVVEQQFRKLRVDTMKLELYRQELKDKIETYKAKFITLPQIRHHVEYYTRRLFEAYLQETPNGTLTQSNSRFRFNINSKQQLEWLFYDCLGYKPVKQTATGRRSMDKKSLPFLGEPGQILIKYNALVKELGYVEACLNSCIDGYLSVRLKPAGTLTGRAAGG